MSSKNDLPDLYVDEAKTYRTYKELGSTRTTTGNLTFTSISSGTTYSSTTGQFGIMQQLETLLTAYKINADDWNNFNSAITATDNKIGLLSSLTTIDKTNLVNAINENKATVDTVTSLVGGINSNRMTYGDNSRGTTSWTTGVDNILKSGFYYASTNLTNLPNSTDGFIVHNQHYSSNDYATQSYMAYNSSVMYSRKKEVGVWSQWQGVGGVKSIQKGTVSLTGSTASTNVTISSVVTAKSTVKINSINFTYNDGSSANISVNPSLTSSTNILFSFAGSWPGGTTLTWEVVEYY